MGMLKNFETLSETAQHTQELVGSLNRQRAVLQRAISRSRASIDESRNAMCRPFLTPWSNAAGPTTGTSAIAGPVRKQA
jgi:hypothetical protein